MTPNLKDFLPPDAKLCVGEKAFRPPLRNTTVSTSLNIEANSSGEVMKPAGGVGGPIPGLENAAQKIFTPPSCNRSSLQSIAIAANISPLLLKTSQHPPTKRPPPD